MKHFPVSKYTMVHGQCLDVGIGGYLLHGGVNLLGTSDKYGAGMEHVLKYTMVSGNGDIITVDEDNVTQLETGQEVLIKSVHYNYKPHSDDKSTTSHCLGINLTPSTFLDRFSSLQVWTSTCP